VTYEDYAASKAGNWFVALEASKRWGKDGIISISANPGNLFTPMWDSEHWLLVLILRVLVL
jgi:NAD(P)-dependent dehydrogenase (short-subunit alcohol dehydrogenase family)